MQAGLLNLHEAIAVKSLLLVVIVISCDAQPKLGGGWLVGGAVAVAVSAASAARGVTGLGSLLSDSREDGLSLGLRERDL